jgi:ribosome modulation factor
MNRQITDACQDGYDAHDAGKPLSCNPYNTLQPEYAEWNNGWRAADNYDGSDDYGSEGLNGRFEDSPRYRADMIGAGRGRLVR